MKKGRSLFSKLFFTFIMGILVFVSGLGSASASFPSQVGPIQSGETLYVGDVYFPVKYSGDYYTFCTSGINSEVPNGRICNIINPSYWNEGKQAGVAAIINEFNSGSVGFGFAEVAINSFLSPGSVSAGAESLSTVKDLVAKAKKAETKASSEFSVILSTDNLKFTEENGYYISNTVEVSDKNGLLERYDVAVSGIDGVEVFNKNNKSFQVRFPSSKLERGKTVTITAKVTATTSYSIAYNYDCGGGGVQNITINYTEPKKKTAEKSINGKVSKEETSVKISKQDITNKKELPGATLVVKDSKGKEVDKWVSTTEPHYIKNLEPGKYTLNETIAPEGYKLSTETIEFEVKADGKTTSVVMYNEPSKGKAKISKQDITNKEELPGATLVIKDSKGNEIEKWVSTDKPHYVELDPGKYTLSETIAPEGYELTTETIEFEVKADGKTTSVVMYNKPKTTGARISKQDITNKEELPGATLVIKDSKGKEIEKWVSTTEPHFVELKPGKYTLSETIAPEGYKLTTETIEFEVKKDGTITHVIMYNEPSTGVVKISKQDITTKEELPGATLIIKDANGNEVDRWVSTTEPHYVQLKPGEYTLTEVTAPDGYDLSYEVVRFTVNEDGTTNGDVIMYNSKTPNTSDRNMLLIIVGFIGTGVASVFAIKKLKHQM